MALWAAEDSTTTTPSASVPHLTTAARADARREQERCARSACRVRGGIIISRSASDVRIGLIVITARCSVPTRCQERACEEAKGTRLAAVLHKRRTDPGGRSSLHHLARPPLRATRPPHPPLRRPVPCFTMFLHPPATLSRLLLGSCPSHSLPGSRPGLSADPACAPTKGTTAGHTVNALDPLVISWPCICISSRLLVARWEL